MAPVRRRAARVQVIDARERLLLLRGGDPARPQHPIWHTPGGGVEPGERDEVAAYRELVEEIGLHPSAMGPHVWNRRARFSFDGVQYDQDEVFFVLRINDHDVDTTGQTDVAPERFADLLRCGPPTTPVRVEGAVLA